MAATDFDYIATRNEIIEGAFRIVGALEPGQTLSANLLDQGIKALQALIKYWATEHLFLWSFDQTNFVTVAGQEEYDTTDSVDAAIIGLDKAWVVDSGEDLDIEVISYSRYLDIYDKETNSGRPFAIAYKPTPSPTFWLWPSPDAVYTIKALCIFPLQDFDTAAGTGDIPAHFQRALKYGLAEDLFDEYPGNDGFMEQIRKKAEKLFKKTKSFDIPVETKNEVEGLFRVR